MVTVQRSEKNDAAKLERYRLRQAAEDRVRELNDIPCTTASFYKGHREYVVQIFRSENVNEGNV